MAQHLSTSAERPFSYGMRLGTTPFAMHEVRGTEALSHTFRFEGRLRDFDAATLGVNDLVGMTTAVWIDRDGEVLRQLAGVITYAEVSATAQGTPEIFVVVEPRLALLRHRSDMRVFRDMSVPEIVEQVLREMTIGCEQRLQKSSPKLPYCVQFRETDLDFVQRLLEREGIFYAFPDRIHSDADDALHEHAIVIGDDPAAYQPIEGDPPLPYRAASALVRGQDSIWLLRRRARMTAGRVGLCDWNIEKPSLDMSVESKVPTAGSDVLWFDAPGKYELPPEGERLARIHAEALACEARELGGKSDAARMAPCRSFQLAEAPGGLSGRYAVTRVTHDWKKASGEEAARFELSFGALPEEVCFRPLPETPSPMITSPLIGKVTGPPGEDIHTDALGRVKVHFVWDRQQAPDDHASHWIPVLQDNTGHSAAIPRVGWEVLVGFVDGDPDRPYVLGRVYNGIDQFPETLPAGKTKTALRSLSSPSRTGQNQIWIDDAAGSELVAVQAEKDQTVTVAHDKLEQVDTTEASKIEKDETITIGADNKVVVADGQRLAIDGAQSIKVGGSRRRKVGGTEQVNVGGARSLSIGGSHMRRIGGMDNVGAPTIKEKIGGVNIEASLGPNATAAAALGTLTVGGAVLELAGQGKAETTEMLRVETIGMKLITRAKAMFSLDVGGTRRTRVGAMLTAMGTLIGLRAGTKLTAKGQLTTSLDGSESLTIESGGSKVTLTADGITMETDKDIVIQSKGTGTLMAAEAFLDE